VLVVLASRHDPAARALCERAAPGSARVLAWRDLSISGWRYHGAPDDGDDAIVLGGARIAAAAISAVVTRCPSVPPHELSHIVPADRAYVAAEMTATLRAVLARLRCPVVNRPTASSLCGPRWHPERWTTLAASLGLRVLPLARRAVPGLAPSPPRLVAPAGRELHRVTVVGAQTLGTTGEEHEPRPELADAALALARAADVTLLRVDFAVRGAERWFVGASLDPDVGAAPVADALLDHLGIALAEPLTSAPR